VVARHVPKRDRLVQLSGNSQISPRLLLRAQFVDQVAANHEKRRLEPIGVVDRLLPQLDGTPEELRIGGHEEEELARVAFPVCVRAACAERPEPCRRGRAACAHQESPPVDSACHQGCSQPRSRMGRPKNNFPTSVAGTRRVPSAGYGTRRVPATPQMRKSFFGRSQVNRHFRSARQRGTIAPDGSRPSVTQPPWPRSDPPAVADAHC